MSSVAPGWRWGPFTARVPLVHLKPSRPELVQGLAVASATGLAVVPIYAEQFGMAFETAVAMVVLQSLIVCSSFLVFGEPYCPGWLTPAIPLVLREAALAEGVEARIDYVNAVVLTTAAVFLVFGLTGLGKQFVRAVPRAVKAGIVLGAGFSAVQGEFLARTGGRPARLEAYPWSIGIAVGVTLLLLFSRPFARWRRGRPAIETVAAMGIAPGFILAMIAGPWFSELDYTEFRQFAGAWLVTPDFAGLFAGYSALGRGLPSTEALWAALPLALAAYTIGFGDIVTGTAIVEEAAPDRLDDPPPLDPRRTHLSVGLRNAAAALLGGPFFAMHGPMWTGATVVIVERWRQGPRAMRSLFDGVSSYYLFGLPLVYFIGPAVALLRPALDVAFSLTLLITGFACGYVAMEMARDRLERGAALLTAATLVVSSVAAGLAVGFAATLLLMGRSAWAAPDAILEKR